MNSEQLLDRAKQLAAKAERLAEESARLAQDAAQSVTQNAPTETVGVDPFIFGLTVLVLSCFVGYYVVWRVTPALHSPLMSVTNAISSVIIVGALIAAGPADANFSQIMGFCAVVLASVNIFGGFIVTQRMLSMFKKKR
jgi:H+-translocating NAD(P) transhydrogenase subunit alpha